MGDVKLVNLLRSQNMNFIIYFTLLCCIVNAQRLEYVAMLPLNRTSTLSFSVQGDIPSSTAQVMEEMVAFLPRMSRNRIHLQGSTTTNMGTSTSQLMLRFIAGADSHVPIVGNVVTAKHEFFHLSPFT